MEEDVLGKATMFVATARGFIASLEFKLKLMTARHNKLKRGFLALNQRQAEILKVKSDLEANNLATEQVMNAFKQMDQSRDIALSMYKFITQLGQGQVGVPNIKKRITDWCGCDGTLKK